MNSKTGNHLSGSASWSVLLALSSVLLVQTAVLALKYRAVSSTECIGVLLVASYLLLFANRRPIPTKPAKPLAAGTWLTRLILRLFMAFGASVSLIAPWPFMLRGGYPAISLLSPHMFMYGVQLLFEIWCFRTGFSPTRLVITISFNAYRLWTIFVWVEGAKNLVLDTNYVRLLGIINLVFWGFVLQILLVQIAPMLLLPKKQRTTKSELNSNDLRANRSSDKNTFQRTVN